ncbi:uncharacterized protein JCM6883_006157 [Sporobolomyces salmoneus]|uniref:uncharacterized protein n=1 Tax=Sporobolomyces salmoneus TaxID=183962 RepID=UPI003179B443
MGRAQPEISTGSHRPLERDDLAGIAGIDVLVPLDPEIEAFPPDVALDTYKSTLCPKYLTLIAQSRLTFYDISRLTHYLARIQAELTTVQGSANALPASSPSTSRNVSPSRPPSFPASNRPRNPSTPLRTSSSGVQRPARSSSKAPPPTPPIRTGAPIGKQLPEYSSADQVPNYDRWKPGLFYSKEGVFKFRGGDKCFQCFGAGHYSEGCPLRADPAGAGKARAKVLEAVGIFITPSSAKSLVAYGKDEEEFRRQCGNEDSIWYNGGDAEARFITADNGNLPPLEEFDYSDDSLGLDDSLDNPPHLASPTTRHARIARVIPSLDLPDLPPSAKAFAVKLIDRITPQPKTRPLLDRLSFSKKERRQLSIKTKTTLARPLSARISKNFARRVSSLSSKVFIWDTGASIYITDQLDILHLYEELPPSRQIRIGGAWGGSGMAVGKGTLKTDFILEDGRISSVDILDVYYAPDIGHNLLSGLQLMAQGFTTTNTKTKVDLFAPDGDLVAHFKIDLSHGSIVVPARWIPAPFPPPVPSLTVLPAVDLSTWHERLGHAGRQRLEKMMDEDSSHTEVGERLHIDVWGNAPEIGRRNGEEYVFGCIDDYSRYLTVDGMKKKSEVPQLLVDTITKLETQRGVKVKIVRRDGAKENTSRQVNEFFSSKGIVTEDTVPYAHNQNGVIERVWKSVIGIARTWLIRAGLPRSFWFLAVQAASYVYNRLPHSSNDDRSPYSRFFGSTPDVSHLRVFGSVAHVLIDSALRGKLSPRTHRCIFVGYLENTKGWLFYHIASRKFITGVNVKWFEDKFYADAQPEWLQQERESIARWNPIAEEEDSEEGGADQGGAKNEEIEQRSSDVGSSLSPSSSPALNESPPLHPDPVVPDLDTSPACEEIPPASIPPSHLPGYRLLPPDDEDFSTLGTKWGKKESTGRLRSRPKSIAKALRNRLLPSSSDLIHSIFATAALDLSLQPSDSTVKELAEIEENGSFALVRVATSTNPDAPSFKTAMLREDKAQWMVAVDTELTAMKERGVFDEELVDLPRGGKAIPLKWVLLVKRDEFGNVVKYKAQLVARGDLQRPGIDFSEVFSSTIRFTSILVLLALAVTNGWNILQFDVSTAFLHAKLDDKLELFVRQPPGFENLEQPTKVHRLRKSLYGLRQAGRLWSEHFIGCLKEMGFEQSKADESLFVRWRNGKVAIISIHVDDGLREGGTSRTLPWCQNCSTRDGTISLDQAHYVDKLAERFKFDGESQRVFTTPFDKNTDISPRREDEPKFDGPYREILGAVVYLSTCTRPDISCTVSIASRFASDPAPCHFKILKRLLRYLINTRSLGLRFIPGQPLSLTGFSDADHAADPDTRRSITGWAFTLAGAAVSWQSKRQPTVALSSTEAETLALSAAICEAIWLRSLLTDLRFPLPSPTTPRVDNSSCILLAHHPTHHHRTKHFAVHARFSREKLASGDVQLEWIPTDLQPSDVLTKGLYGEKHRQFSEALGLSDVSRKGVCWRVVTDGCAIESDWFEVSELSD